MVDHSGCSGSFENGAQIVDKVRQMGFSEQFMPMPFDITCECGETFEMDKFEGKCPKCGMVFGVTPCHAFAPENIMPAGIDY
jgi:Zn finger protein HypA/HybF involved in hydrogenase expression